MKILSIRIKNLASLAGEHFIDFESEPLASAGLIAIIGKTGAGKSTILDAMCLALFNQVPRLKGSDGKLVDVDGSELPSNSPLTVLRRGTGHGFAELCFVAQDQKHYLARWEIKRARENAVGKLQNVQRSLTCLTDGVVVADKTKAVETHIQHITQLSFEQFTRAVLLAQSEVTAFLKARDNERGALLEYLTNSNIFAKIGEIAFRKTADIEKERKKLEDVLGHIEILSDEAIAELNQQFINIDAEYKKLETEKKLLEQQQQWFEHKQKLDTDIQLRQQQLLVQQQQFEQLAPQRIQLKQLEAFASIRPSVIQQHKVLAELHTLQPQIQSSEQQFIVIEHTFQAEEKQFKQIDEQFKTQQAFEQTHHQAIEKVRTCIQEREFIGQQFKKAQASLQQLNQEQQPLLQQQIQLHTEIEKLQNQQQTQTEQLHQSAHFVSLDTGLSAHLTQLQRFIQQYQNVEQQFGNIAAATIALNKTQQQLHALQQQFGHEDQISSKLADQRQNREHALQQIHHIGLIQTQFKQFSQVCVEREKVKSSNNELSQKLEQAIQQQQQTEQKYLTQKQDRESLQRVLQQQRLLHTESIEKLREQLLEGEACLVCGSKQHPFKQEHSALSQELLNLQQQQEQQALQLENQSFDVWQKSQQLCTQQHAALTQNTLRLNELQQQSTQLEQQLKSALDSMKISLDFNPMHENTAQQLFQLSEKYQQDIQQLDHTLAQLNQAQKNQREQLQTIQHIQQHLSTIQHAEQNIQHLIDLLSAEQKHAWKTQTSSTAKNIEQQLMQRLQLLQTADTLNKQLDEKIQALKQIEQNIAFKNEQIQSTTTEKSDFERQGQNNKELAMTLIFEMSQIQVEKPHEWLLQYDEQRKNLHMKFNQARQNIDQSRQQFEQQKRQRDQLKTQLTQLEIQQTASALEIQQWLNQHADFDAILIEQLRQIPNEQQQQIRLNIQTAERSLNDVQSALKTIQEQLQQHAMQQPNIEFEQLQTQMIRLVENLQATLDIRDGCKLKLEVHQRNIDKQKQFADQIQAIQQQEHRWGKISGLIGDAKGKDFRDYAQQYNLDILLEHANQQLAMLSQRYTLKRLENSLSLAIVDHDMDGETRSVSSLSGGESFLTALALSLAIANMASGSMKIESLFIDEGFGTLDASSLYMVMNALDQLQNQGRKVVLISHIQEMHERIPVQIQVKPLGAGASTIQVVG